MVRKSDDVPPVLPHSGDVIANLTSNELEDETAALVAITVEQVIRDHASSSSPDVSAEGSNDVPPVLPGHDEPLKPGFLLSHRYEIVELVHSGGMSHVYKAIDKRRHLSDTELIHVAIKMMRNSVAPHLNAHAALEREAAKVRRLSHPNIISVYDFDEHDGQFFLVMEWLEGETVNALLRRTSGRRLEPQFAWRVIQSIAAGVQHAHLNNVVHADINPSNVFITDTQEIKLLDFGVARDVVDPPDATVSEIVWATRTYASPEVLSGLAPVFEDDIFALGCITYRLLSGKHPYGCLSSIEARRTGFCVQPISGLAEAEAETLNRALSYQRSDRPRTADVFAPAVPAASEAVAAMPPGVRSPANRVWQVPLVIMALLAGTWWLSQSNRQTEEPANATTTLANDKAIEVAAPAMPAGDETGQLLINADLAMDESRFIAPADNNARDYYREMLLINPADPTALGGLRAISDVYVQQANVGLRSDAPERVAVALAVAAETDPGNPAIAIVNGLLVAQGDRILADAGLAAAKGNIAGSAKLLAVAERYAHLDANEIRAIRSQLAQQRQERQFLAQLDAADELVTAGNLIAPSDDNALVLLLDLNKEHATDSRLVASMEGLGESMLTRAGLATSSGQFREAAELLDAVKTLGVLGPELAAAQEVLYRAEEDAINMLVAPSALAGGPASSTGSGPEESTTALPLENVEAEQTSSPQLLVGGLASLPTSAADLSSPEPDTIGNSGTVATAEPSETRRLTISDLGIEKYVAPRFPRTLQRRGLSGFVDVAFIVNTDGSTGAVKILNSEPGDVFNASVEKAVKKWRFAQRDDEVLATITLRFALER